MRYWWVNQKKTARHELRGGYLWSPKLKRNGARNPYYEFMREVSPGDLVLSFAASQVLAYGIARSFAHEAPKPEEFGAAGRNWDQVGWRVDVEFFELERAFRPRDWIELLRPLLPRLYSPLLPDGRGNQSMYLTELPTPLALQLADLAGEHVGRLARSEEVHELELPEPYPELELWEEHLRGRIEADEGIGATEREALVLARRGQGRFKEHVREYETRCRVTHVERLEHLRASHVRPWRDSTNEERLDGANGLLLTPSIDHLFDRGFLSFEDCGRLLVSPVAHAASLERMGVPTDRSVDVGRFHPDQARYLEYHRDAVLLRARVQRD